MKRSLFCLSVLGIILLMSCHSEAAKSIHEKLMNETALIGKREYLASPYVAAGDRVYVVGHQDGTFPDLGWHVEGEMGGVWNHPIKLFDGYRMAVGINGQAVMCLPDAVRFENFPFATKQTYPAVDGVSISQVTFVPDGLEGAIVEYQFHNTLDETLAMDVAFSAFVDLQPVWLAEKLELEDGDDAGFWDAEKNQLMVKDSLNDWYAVVGSDANVQSVSTQSICDYGRRGNGTTYSLKSQIKIDGGEKQTIQYYLSGSAESRSVAEEVNDQLKGSAVELLATKQNRYQKLNAFNQLETNDDQFDQMYEWVRYNTDWLIRDVPSTGRGLSAGIPDYPWWFGTDNGYAVEGMLAYGMFEEAIATIDLIIKLSTAANGDNGQIMHEASTNGVVFNPGNLNTTPRFVQTLWMTYAWTGDDKLFQKYWPLVQKSMKWIESQDHDSNGYPDGPGMMEIPGLHTEMIDVVAYQQQAYQAAAKFAEVAGDTIRFDSYTSIADQLAKKINDEWWSDQFQSFADFRATKEEAIALTKAAIIRADTIDKPWSVDELKQTLSIIENNNETGADAYVVHHNWVVNTPMETGVAYDEYALKALEHAKKYRNRFGMFVTGIDRDEAQEGATQWKSFSYVGAVMTLPTGVQAISSARYRRIDDTFGYLKNLQNSFGYALPGSMYEVSPDFGMIAQAWNAYAVAVPTVQYIVGITPRSHLKQWVYDPQLPMDLTELTLNQIRMGDNLVSITMVRENDSLKATVLQSDPKWEIQIPDTENLRIDSEPIKRQNGHLVVSGSEISIAWSY